MPTLPLAPTGPASPAEPQLSTSRPGGPKEHLAPRPPLQEQLRAPAWEREKTFPTTPTDHSCACAHVCVTGPKNRGCRGWEEPSDAVPVALALLMNEQAQVGDTSCPGA